MILGAGGLGEECGFVLKGFLERGLDGEICILNEGDSNYFESSCPHLARNLSDPITMAIWTITPRAF